MQHTTITYRGTTPRKETLMGSITSTTTLESEVREFAREFPTPQVQRLLALTEARRISWAEAHEISRRALAAGLGAVA